ncbi:MAG: polysaccharide deacetylase family protein [Verrucomicrobiae bacterium]|nr:polysaccharide deacetylase family protein [Verrucomicrobiae bacterium]
MYLEILKGFADGIRRRQRFGRGIRVLYYHGIVEQRKDPRLERNCHTIEEFKDQIRALKRARASVLSLDELDAQFDQPGRGYLPRVVITFDDGYQNNLIAAELLEAARMPWALFVSTGLIGSERTVWTVELSLLMLHGQAESIELLGNRWSLRTRADREQSFQGIRVQLKQCDSEKLHEHLIQLRSQFPPGESQRLIEAWPGFQMLRWNEVASIAASGGTIGSHGVDHELHHASQLPETRLKELRDSKRELEQQLDSDCPYFAFPNGSTHPGSAQELDQVGYRLAFTTVNRCLGTHDSRLLIPRIGAAGSMRSFVRDYFWADQAMENLD